MATGSLRPIPIGLPNTGSAYAEETGDSRIGLQTGMLGAGNVTRTFRVYNPSSAPGQNPVYTLENLSSALGGVRAGEIFPMSDKWGDGSYVVQFFTIVDHWPCTRVWIVRAHYVPSYLAGFPMSLWTPIIRSGLESERILVDLDGKGIGAPKYRPVSSGGSHKAVSPDHPEVGLVQAFTDLQSAPRYMVGADRPKRTSTLTITKIVETWRLSALASVVQSKKWVNTDDFVVNTVWGPIKYADAPPPGDENDPSTWGRGIVLFDDFTLEPTPRDNSTVQLPPQPIGPGTITGGPAARLTMTFKIDPDGWQHSLRHMYKWDDGTESPIQDTNGQYIDERFRRVGETSLTALVGAFT